MSKQLVRNKTKSKNEQKEDQNITFLGFVSKQHYGSRLHDDGIRRNHS